MPHRHLPFDRLLQALGAATLATMAGCAPQACSQPDVVAYVNRTAAAHDLDVIGLDGPIGQRPLPGRPMAICSAWMLERNPGFRPGSALPPTLRIARTYSVRTMAQGYEVRLLRPVAPARTMARLTAPGTTTALTR
ncbi:hypothetical protein [Lichenicoccus sp.]|uniref:hypothetical protein n=1 Tax=Lichenicoccus sp. TaxID=2781899 RepID=UPI003D096AC7